MNTWTLRTLGGGGHSAFLLCKETPKQHHLADANEKQQDGFSNRPERHPLKEMLGFDSIVGLSQSVPSLRLGYHFEDLVERDAGGLQLGQGRGARHALHEGLLAAVAELQVDDLVGDGGELVAEAHLVGAARGGDVREAVVLPLHLAEQHVVQGICHEAVHVVVSAGDDLELYGKRGVFL